MVNSLLNNKRPPMFCPGCSHNRSVKVVDGALQRLGRRPDEVVIVSDIGCSGLFDIFFATHAFHGLHGRALTYATGLKLARPELTVIVIMGDGGLGIGGAHVLAACRRNLDLTLLVLNNFNYGMTGGQCSATSFQEMRTGSGFLGDLEPPQDVCGLAIAAGAGFVGRGYAEDVQMQDQIVGAVSFTGFSLVDIWSVCPGRLGRLNRISRKELDKAMAGMTPLPAGGLVTQNARREFGEYYREKGEQLSPPTLQPVEHTIESSLSTRKEVLILGGAGQFITTLAEILCLGAMNAGLEVSLKNDYPITVLRGHSIAEVILDKKPIGYTGTTDPALVLCLSPEGVQRRSGLFSSLSSSCIVVASQGLELPSHAAREIRVDFAGDGLARGSVGIAALALSVTAGCGITSEMIEAGIAGRYSGKRREESLATLRRYLKRAEGA